MQAILFRAFCFICIVLAGFLLRQVGVFDKRDFQAVKKVIVTITLPAAVINSFSSFERNMSLIYIAGFGLGFNLLMVMVGYLVKWKKSSDEKAFAMLNMSGYNIGTFATPYLSAFLGAEGSLVACIFDCGNAIMCSGLTYALACAVSGKTAGDGGVKGFFKLLFSSVIFDTYVLMLIMYVLDLRFPAPVYSLASAFAGANTFLAMFMIGGAIEIIMKKEYLRTIAETLVIRYSLAAVFAVLIMMLLPYSLEIRQIMAILVLSPITSMAVVYSSKGEWNEGASGVINSCAIMISLVIMTTLVSVWHLGA
jgi:hypothetical protein